MNDERKVQGVRRRAQGLNEKDETSNNIERPMMNERQKEKINREDAKNAKKNKNYLLF